MKRTLVCLAVTISSALAIEIAFVSVTGFEEVLAPVLRNIYEGASITESDLGIFARKLLQCSPYFLIPGFIFGLALSRHLKSKVRTAESGRVEQLEKP